MDGAGDMSLSSNVAVGASTIASTSTVAAAPNYHLSVQQTGEASTPEEIADALLFGIRRARVSGAY